MNESAAEPRHAATVLLLRQGRSAPIEVFMVKRHGKSGFMAGAYVFPGGKLDDSDCSPGLAKRCAGRTASQCADALSEDLKPDLARGLFVAAARETFEEAGVILAHGQISAEGLRLSRASLETGEANLEQILQQNGLELDLEALVPWSRWITPTVEKRRFDTRFFMARVPDRQEASHDTRETTAQAWLSPGEAFERADAGELSLPPPTYRTLEQLANHDSVQSVMEAARGSATPLIAPEVHSEAGAVMICLPGDPLHTSATRALPGPTRVVLRAGKWRSEDPAPEG